jgi:hypothetical protein
MTIIGLVIVTAQLWRKVGPLQSEVRRLRDELGVLVVDDPAKVCAIMLGSQDELTWKWQVWIPENHAASLKIFNEMVPQSGIPVGGSSLDLEPGDQIVVYQIKRNPRDGKWNGSLRVEAKAKMSTTGRGGYVQPWVEWKSVLSQTEGAGRKTRSIEPGKPLVLIRRLVWQPTTKRKPSDPADGFMIWLETAK